MDVPNFTANMLTTPEGVEQLNLFFRRLVEQSVGVEVSYVTTGGLDPIPHDIGRPCRAVVVSSKPQQGAAGTTIAVSESTMDPTNSTTFLQSNNAGWLTKVRLFPIEDK